MPIGYCDMDVAVGDPVPEAPHSNPTLKTPCWGWGERVAELSSGRPSEGRGSGRLAAGPVEGTFPSAPLWRGEKLGLTGLNAPRPFTAFLRERPASGRGRLSAPVDSDGAADVLYRGCGDIVQPACQRRVPVTARPCSSAADAAASYRPACQRRDLWRNGEPLVSPPSGGSAHADAIRFRSWG